MVDYSKWNHIEVSDDEDDTHPNIDTPSLFRWRHRARVERMEALEEKVKNFNTRKENCLKEQESIKKRIEQFKKDFPDKELPLDYQKQMKDMECQLEDLKEEEMLLEKEKKHQPLNVDTLSKERFSKSIVNPIQPKKIPKTDEEVCEVLKKFSSEHNDEAKHFGMISKVEDSSAYLKEHPHLASEEAANFLCIWCIDLAEEGKMSLMERVAKQAVTLQFLLEIAKSQNVHPRDMIGLFFARIGKMDQEYQKSYDLEVEAFKERVMKAVERRIAEKAKTVPEEEEVVKEEKQLGPGGLDPIEVLESLPADLKECFITRDVEMLKRVIASMDPEDAKYHFKRCVDSGLWVSNAQEGEEEEMSDEYENLECSDKTEDQQE